MAAQSGIAPTSDLTDKWGQFLSSSNERLFKISIEKEQLQPSGTWTVEGQDDTLDKVFAQLTQPDIVEDKVPAYFVIRTSAPTAETPSFAFISYVPDHAQVRAKMLYASTRTTLIRFLGDSRFTDSIFATSKEDLTYESYHAHTRHAAASAPLTAREQEMAEIKAAEAATADDSQSQQQHSGRSAIFGEKTAGEGQVRGALPWSDEAKEAARALQDGRELVQLEIELGTETVVLSDPQPTTLSVPVDKPCYLFYRHPAGVVLIYSCPPKSPIKSRLVYSSAVLVFYKHAAKEYAGIEVLKKLETDDPNEVTREWIDAELGPLATTSPPDGGEASVASRDGAPMPKEDKVAFARPSRPGRRR
ncbi:twinfilin TWF1 [Sporobolomyces koalae]|uniref:twinfilin TWF1 n=1 Tax=Sporobolomyces koalae TaxID=500713 RepID=UPI003174567C